MSQLHCNRKRRSGQHLTLNDRKVLEYVYNANLKLAKHKRKKQKQLAEDLGWSPATLSRELKRGRVKQQTSQLEEYWTYSSVVAQENAESKWESKGPGLKLGKDHELADTIEKMLLGKKAQGMKALKYSPEAIVMHFDRVGWPTGKRLCARTIYNYVESDVFLRVTRRDLPRQGSKPRGSYKRVEKRLRPPSCKRIDERPKAAEEKLEVGHWEMDCIESIKSDKTCLLTLVDRVSRDCILFKLGNQTQAAVVRRLNGLERSLGTKHLKKSSRPLR